MGLLTIIKKVKQKEREMRLLMVGLDNAGKTTIVKKFNGERIDTISPTLGFNIKTLEFLGYCRRCRLPYMGSGLIALFGAQIQAKYLGRRRAAQHPNFLAKLFRADRRAYLGRGLRGRRQA